MADLIGYGEDVIGSSQPGRQGGWERAMGNPEMNAWHRPANARTMFETYSFSGVADRKAKTVILAA